MAFILPVILLSIYACLILSCTCYGIFRQRDGSDCCKFMDIVIQTYIVGDSIFTSLIISQWDPLLDVLSLNKTYQGLIVIIVSLLTLLYAIVKLKGVYKKSRVHLDGKKQLIDQERGELLSDTMENVATFVDEIFDLVMGIAIITRTELTEGQKALVVSGTVLGTMNEILGWFTKLCSIGLDASWYGLRGIGNCIVQLSIGYEICIGIYIGIICFFAAHVHSPETSLQVYGNYGDKVMDKLRLEGKIGTHVNTQQNINMVQI